MKIAIIGAGLVGRLTALKLILAGHDLTILEAQSFDHPHNAAAMSAGLVAPLSESVHTTPEMTNLGFRSSVLWPSLLNELKELDPEHETVFYSTAGTIAISFPEEQECLLQYRKQLVTALPEQKQNIQMLYNDEVMAIEPELSRFETAIYLANEGNLCNHQFLQSSSRALRKHASFVDHWALQGDGSDLQAQYDFIFDCRGAGAVNAHTRAETDDHSLVSVRGEAIRVRSTDVKLLRPVRVIQQRFDIFIVPKPHDIFVVGGTELDKHGTHAVTVRSSLDLLSAIYALHPGFADAEIIEAIAGQRSVYSNKNPSITVSENIACINGLSRQGWLAGPALVEQMLQQVL